MSKKPETLIVEKIHAAIRQRGAFSEKIHGSKAQRKGMPDVFACVHGVWYPIEAKTPTGDLSPAQIQVIKEIEAAGGTVYVVTSRDEALRAVGLLK